MFQSTPSRGGRLNTLATFTFAISVSIHALTRRATVRLTKAQSVAQVSIHALTRRATVCKVDKTYLKNVSIHALTRRATVLIITCGIAKQRFQSTPSRGGRRKTEFINGVSNLSFNPRPHAEGDKYQKKNSCVIACFNPRPHAEGDYVCMYVVLKYQVSIHALTRRATFSLIMYDGLKCVSIHALTRRATNGSVLLAPRSRVSIHALTRRATVSQKSY